MKDEIKKSTTVRDQNKILVNDELKVCYYIIQIQEVPTIAVQNSINT